MVNGSGNGKSKALTIPTYPVTLLWYPRMPEKDGPKNWSGYAWVEESLLPGGTSPVITSYDDDDLVSVSGLFARAGPAPTTTTATAAGTDKRQISWRYSE